MWGTFRIGDHATVTEVRQANLDQWRLGPESYFGSTPQWVRPEREVLRGIEHPTHDVQKLLDAVPAYPVTAEGIQAAWAHHMSLHAGCHPWPNANHRTAMRTFNLSLGRAQGWCVGFAEAEVGHQLIHDSHQQRDADGGEYTLMELQDRQHVYRRLFASYAAKLLIVPFTQAAGLAAFGERPHPAGTRL